MKQQCRQHCFDMSIENTKEFKNLVKELKEIERKNSFILKYGEFKNNGPCLSHYCCSCIGAKHWVLEGKVKILEHCLNLIEKNSSEEKASNIARIGLEKAKNIINCLTG